MSSVSVSLLSAGGDSSATGCFTLSFVGVRDSVSLNRLLVRLTSVPIPNCLTLRIAIDQFYIMLLKDVDDSSFKFSSINTFRVPWSPHELNPISQLKQLV